MKEIAYGPLPSESNITSLVDYYKVTMSQFAYENQPDAEVTFTFKNRTDIKLGEFLSVEDVQDRLDFIGSRGFEEREIDYLRSLTSPNGKKIFTDDYLDNLADTELPQIKVDVNDEGDLEIESTGDWPSVTYWETVAMATVNEMYFEEVVSRSGKDLYEIYDEGDRRISEKFDAINQYNDTLSEDAQPLQFVEFGTRRHFSTRWQNHVIDRMDDEMDPNVFLGTSNVYLSAEIGRDPAGTYAHEMPMVYAGLNNETDEELRDSHSRFLKQWADRFPHLKTALTDTFGDDFFFADFEESGLAFEYNALRHDSGDPFKYGEKVIEFYNSNGIKPSEKTIFFSDGLDIELCKKLHAQFSGRIRVVFGVGTNWTNDLGEDALSIVMKATEVNGEKTVKLSNNPNKFTGPEEEIERYVDTFDYVVENAVATATRY